MDFDIDALFAEHDHNHDGLLTVDESFNLLKKLGVNVYKGSVSKVPFAMTIKDCPPDELYQPRL